MSNTIVSKPFYGYLETLQPQLVPIIVDALNTRSSVVLNGHKTAKAVTEEIVKRKGFFYTAAEAEPNAPFAFTDKMRNAHFAKFPYINGEIKPVNPAFADYNWLGITMYHYAYGIYLTGLINENKLSVEEL